MKKLIELIHFSIIGAGIGAIVTSICMCCIAGKTCNTKDFAIWIAASALMGILTLVMYTDKLKLITATLIHSVGSFLIVFASSILCGYGNGIVEIVKNILPVFIIVYLGIYCVVFIISKVNEKIVNKELGK